MNVLVIDRVQPFLDAVRRCAAGVEGCIVTTVRGVEAGLRAARVMRPEMVLADHELRTTDGTSVIHALRPLLPEAVLVCLSLGDEGEPCRARWRRSADVCMEKTRLAETLPALLDAARH